MRNAWGRLHTPAETCRSKKQNTMKEEFLCRIYNWLNLHSGNVVTYRYVNSRRKGLGMSRDSVRILHEVNTATNWVYREDSMKASLVMNKYSYVLAELNILSTFLCFLCKSSLLLFSFFPTLANFQEYLTRLWEFLRNIDAVLWRALRYVVVPAQGFYLCFRLRYYHPSSYVTSVSNGQNFVSKPPTHFKGTELSFIHISIACDNFDIHGTEIIWNFIGHFRYNVFFIIIFFFFFFFFFFKKAIFAYSPVL